MCGLGGFIGIKNVDKRFALAVAMGNGLDSRGGDAAGYVSATPHTVKYGRKLSTWHKASYRFLREASALDGATIMHARYATCGDKTVQEAHPYRIERLGRVLWGAHNGVIFNARASATANGRAYDVDSRELFELIADDRHDTIGDMTGWGVVAWIEKSDRTTIRLVKISSDGCIEVAKTKCGAVVFASTLVILKAALRAAGLEIERRYKIELGKQYAVRAGSVVELDKEPRLALSEYESKSTVLYGYDSEEDWAADSALRFGRKQWNDYAASKTPLNGVQLPVELRDDKVVEVDFEAIACPKCGSHNVDARAWGDISFCASCDYVWNTDDPTPTTNEVDWRRALELDDSRKAARK